MFNNIDFYREILDNLYDGIFFVNPEGLISYWNKGAANLTGYQTEDVIDRNYCEVFKPLDKHGNDLCTYSECPMQRVLTTVTLSEVEAYIRHKEGYLVPISIRIAPVREVDRQFIVAVEIFSNKSPRYALRQKLEELQDMALFDTLTGLANRRFLEMNLATRLEELRRYDLSFAIMFIDVDRFKNINDMWGHQAGDQMLKMISTTMINSLRSCDIIGRWGGEEFVALLINIAKDDLFPVVDRFRRLVANSLLPLEDGQSLSATVSIGATTACKGDTMDMLIERSDRLMYESKHRGRNLVTVGP
ncbi:MAG TPA: sensor domain-containing diguanylate cyclase [Desulfuromonadaceae bacterium]|jgi:diguanylate cyclase (GGDEF)-like protein/PAS domain S-box-containing protein